MSKLHSSRPELVCCHVQRWPAKASSGPANDISCQLEQPSSSNDNSAVQQAHASAQLEGVSSTMQPAVPLPPARSVQPCEDAMESSSAIQPSPSPWCSKKRNKEDEEDVQLQQAAPKRARSREPDSPNAAITGQSSFAARDTAACSSIQADSSAGAATEDAGMPAADGGDDAEISARGSPQRSVRIAKRRAHGVSRCE